MKTLRLACVFSLVVIAGLVQAATWWPGIIHAHSNVGKDDGWISPGQLKSNVAGLKLRFLIPTKHYDNELENLDYFKLFSDGPEISGTGQQLVVLPGYEFSINNPEKEKPKVGLGDILGGKINIGKIIVDGVGESIANKKNKVGTSHTLGIGDATTFCGEKQVADVPGLLTQIQQNGMLSIAAHPNNAPLGYWNFVFEKQNANCINGVEFFNEGTAETKKTFQWYLDLLGQGRDVFVTSGCDTHSGVDNLDRITWVYTDEDRLTRENLLANIKLGRTIASRAGIYIDKLNYIPEFRWKRVEGIEIKFRVNFDTPFKTSKKIQIYCNKNLIQESVQSVPKGEKSFDYAWKAKGVYPGANNIIIVVEDCLVTSPIRLIVGNEPAPAGPVATTNPATVNPNLPPPSTVPEPAYTGGIPILFGKNFKEISDTIGLPTYTKGEFGGLLWQYQNWPIEPYAFKISFNAYGSDGKETDKKVSWTSCFKRIPYDAGPFLKPYQIVPKEILTMEPSEFAYYDESTWANHAILLVIWYRFNRTFVLVVNDSKRPMFDKVKGIDEQGQIAYTFKLNKNSYNFAQADKVIGFVCIDRYIDFYNRPKGALERISDGDQVYGYLKSIDGAMTGSMKFIKF